MGCPVPLPRAGSALPMEAKGLLGHGQLLLMLTCGGLVVTAIIKSACVCPPMTFAPCCL